VLLVGWISGREGITVRKGAGILLGAAGLAWLVGQSAGPSSRTASLTGDLLILVNATSYGIYLALVKPLMQRYHPVTVVTWVFFFGLFAVVPVGAGQLPQIEWAALPSEVWWSILFVLVGSTFLAYLFNMLALKEVNASVVSIYIYTQPLIATLIAVLSGNDVLHWSMLGSGVMIGAGVWLVSQPGRLWQGSPSPATVPAQKS